MMPTIAGVEGVKIQMFALEHPPRHFHAVFAEHRAQIGIDSLRVLKDRLPRSKLSTVKSWAEPRRDALRRAWDMVTEKGIPEKIP
jgi:Domain of unknown function (DUF4160)